MTPEDVENFAIRAAKGNNGGDWAKHYTEDHKNYWRDFVRDLETAIAKTAILEEREACAKAAEQVPYIGFDVLWSTAKNVGRALDLAARAIRERGTER